MSEWAGTGILCSAYIYFVNASSGDNGGVLE